MVTTRYGKKSKTKLQGKLRQKSKGGNYYYRLMITAGTRKEFTLGTSNYDEAVLKAMELDSIWLAPTKEVAVAQMNALRGFASPELDASFDEAWEIYTMHPNRATPHTVEEQIGYRRTFREFANFASGITTRNVRYPAKSIRAKLDQDVVRLEREQFRVQVERLRFQLVIVGIEHVQRDLEFIRISAQRLAQQLRRAVPEDRQFGSFEAGSVFLQIFLEL